MPKKLTLPMLAILALGAWFIFGQKKGAAAAPASGGAQPQGPSSLEECLASRDAAACASAGFKIGGEVSDLIAKELSGMDGMAPASLEGHMTSLGAYSGLGGHFYGSV